MFDAVIDAEIKNFLWRDLRYKFMGRLQVNYAPVEDNAGLLRHETLAMTRGYAHLGLCKIRTVVSFSSLAQVTPAKSVQPRRPRKMLSIK